jgi:hypothetical protein
MLQLPAGLLYVPKILAMGLLYNYQCFILCSRAWDHESFFKLSFLTLRHASATGRLLYFRIFAIEQAETTIRDIHYPTTSPKFSTAPPTSEVQPI